MLSDPTSPTGRVALLHGKERAAIAYILSVSNYLAAVFFSGFSSNFFLGVSDCGPAGFSNG